MCPSTDDADFESHACPRSAGALDEGLPLTELEDTLLADGDVADDVAAAWLYAWAYEAVRPSSDRLAERVTDGATSSSI